MDAAIHKGRTTIAVGQFPRDWLITGVVLLLGAVFLFFDVHNVPIVLWDESRNVVNALEMRRSGLGLVTTYEFAPDLWNTKPPLLIWLMTASAALFGPSEWALRLPSAIAALGTLLLTMSLTRRVTGSAVTAAMAGAFVLLSPGFFGEHGAQTADFDALLLFFATAYLYLLFQAVHQRSPGMDLLAGTGALVACAVLTKSTAGLIPGVGVAIYLLLTGRAPRLWSTRGYVLMAMTAAVPVLLFYVLREWQSPGYLHAAWYNDFAGRFRDALIGRDNPPDFYLRIATSGWFFAGPLLLAIPFALRLTAGKSRALLVYALCVAVGALTVLSFASTKYIHYALPVVPWLAIATAITLHATFRRLAGGSGRLRPILVAAALAVVGAVLAVQAANALDWRYRLFPERQFYPEARYGELLESLSRQGLSEVDVVDRGFPLDGWPHYAPRLRAYRLIWQERGLLTRHHAGPASLPRGAVIVASCNVPDGALVRAMGTDIGGVAGCVAVRALDRGR